MKKSVFVVMMSLAVISYVDAMVDLSAWYASKRQADEDFMSRVGENNMSPTDIQDLNTTCRQSILFAPHAEGAKNPAYLVFGVKPPAHSYFSGPTGQSIGCEQQRECDSEQVGNEELIDSSKQKSENTRGRRARKARWVERNPVFPCCGFQIPTQINNWIGYRPH